MTPAREGAGPVLLALVPADGLRLSALPSSCLSAAIEHVAITCTSSRALAAGMDFYRHSDLQAKMPAHPHKTLHAFHRRARSNFYALILPQSS